MRTRGLVPLCPPYPIRQETGYHATWVVGGGLGRDVLVVLPDALLPMVRGAPLAGA